MICAACGTATESREACAACGADPVLDGRYELSKVLGSGARGTTYRAKRLADDAPFAIKELLLRSINAFKDKELFDREAAVLQELSHKGVPAYADHFATGSGKQTAFYLVQELVEGKTLHATVNEKRLAEPTICALLADLCDILVYLHSLRPPVIHRDIKPSNIIQRPDKTLALIDFGAVRDALSDQAAGGSTIAGTFGFMAPEQFAGRALPQTDLYAVGATAVALLAREEPSALVGADQRLNWREKVHASVALTGLIEDLLSADPDDRPDDAARIAQRFRLIGEGSPDPDGTSIKRPRGELAVAWSDPPQTPREASFMQISRFDASARFKFLFGTIFGGFGFAMALGMASVFATTLAEPIFALIPLGIGSIFGGIGGIVGRLGYRRVKRIQKIYRNGDVAVGTLLRAHFNTSVSINGQHPTVVQYSFDVVGRTYKGKTESFSHAVHALPDKAEMAIIYDPDNPTANVAYLPE